MNAAKSNMLVTAATGRPGLATVRECSRQGVPVRALYRTPEKANVLEHLLSVEAVHGDMMLPHTLSAALEGIEVVLMISAAGPELLETQCTFIDTCKTAGVRHIVKFSGEDSTIGFENAKFRSTRNHDQIERYLLASGVPWTILRPSQFMEVYLEEVASILKDEAIFLPAANTTLAPVAVDDIAKVALSILRDYKNHASRIYKMTGPEALTIAAICERISEATGNQITYVNSTPEESFRRWLELGYPRVRATVFAQLWEERKRCGVSKVYLGTHDWFGIAPTTFLEFARKNAPAFRGEREVMMTPGIEKPK
jgi:uncharacterized protein YbjT (DUF2867 family)